MIKTVCFILCAMAAIVLGCIGWLAYQLFNYDEGGSDEQH